MEAAEFREIFAEEATTHLSTFENGILTLEKDPADTTAIHDIFRAVHTLKGASAMVGLTATSNFAHAAETFLEAVRNGELKLSHDTVGLLLSVHDALKLTVDHEIGGAIDAALKTETGKLIAALHETLGKPRRSSDTEQSETVVMQQKAEAGPVVREFKLEIRCRPEMAQNGFDPLAFIRYLKTMGAIHACTVLPDFPVSGGYDPELLHLGFDVVVATDKGKEALADVFSLAGDLVAVKITGDASAETPNGSVIGSPLLSVSSGVPTTQPPKEESEMKRFATDLKQKNFLRIESERLDSLIDSIGELVMTGAALKTLNVGVGDERYQDHMALLERQVETMRDTAMQLRTFSLSEVFRRFERVVRDVSAQAGKQVRLEIHGGDTEIDKNLMDGVYDPLVHIIRNSVDHGIESAQLRRERGKSPVGLISVRAERMAGMIYINIEDDGGGPDLGKIEKRARERGLIKEGQPTERELIDMVFQPGFSTAEKVTALSGRGVGMDVVRQNVNRLNGSVSMSRAPAGGTLVSIRLPLTLAIIDGLVVESASSRYVIPLDQVVECVDYAELGTGGGVENTGIFDLRGEALPVISLTALFGETGHDTRVVVVVQSGEKRRGIFIDKPLGEQQVVVKPVENIPGMPRVFNGATILGDGQVALILDLTNLIESARNLTDNLKKGLIPVTGAESV